MIRILTDSASDITPGQAREMGVDFVSLNVRFPDRAYDQGQDEDFSQFYSMLMSEKVFPTTSQPSPEAFARVFQSAKDVGDSVIAILISSGLSGTLQSAQIAKDTVGYADIHLIDSRAAIMPQRMMVECALRLRDGGADVSTIIEKVSALGQRVKVFGMIATLTYLYKGGRLSRTAAIAGNLLHIRPIVTLKDGVIALIGRGRNEQALLKRLNDEGCDTTFPIYFGYTSDDTAARRLMAQTQEKYPGIQTGLFPLSGVIGAHIGPEGVAIAFVTPEA